MTAVSENLDRRFQSFISNEQPFYFFKGLSEYLAYALATPILKAVVNAQLAERDARYAEIAGLEEKAVTEMQQAKTKLLAVVEKTGMDTKSLRRIRAMSDANLIEELNAYERGDYHRTGRRSDNLQHYLFEVAANIRSAGHENKIREFVATSDQYEEYERHKNGSSMYHVFGNEHGRFIFSQTWPDRFQTETLLAKERGLKPWGDFEALLRFKSAYNAVSKNGDFTSILQEENFDIFPVPINDDKVAIAFMAEDLQILMGDGHSTYRNRYSHTPDEIRELRVDTFKAHSNIVHGHLMSVATTMLETHTVNDLAIEVYDALKTRSDAMPSTKEGNFAELDERDLLKSLAIGHLYISKEDARKAILSLEASGKISLADGDSGFPNHDRGGANYHYRYKIAARATTEPACATKELSVADKKRLFILEKLKEEHDLAPKQNARPTMLQEAIVVYAQRAGEINIPRHKFVSWQNECGITDYYQLQNILATFQQEGLIESFRILDEYE